MLRLPKRRKDLEQEFHRKFEPWLSAWEAGGSIYTVANPLHPTFWKHIWIMWEGRRLWAVWFWLRHPVQLWWTQ